MKNHIHRYLDLSTAHLTQETFDRLHILRYNLGCTISRHRYGFMMTLPESFDLSVSTDGFADLAKVFAYARSKDCSLVSFDADGPKIDDLPVYEW